MQYWSGWWLLNMLLLHANNIFQTLDFNHQVAKGRRRQWEHCNDRKSVENEGGSQHQYQTLRLHILIFCGQMMLIKTIIQNKCDRPKWCVLFSLFLHDIPMWKPHSGLTGPDYLRGDSGVLTRKVTGFQYSQPGNIYISLVTWAKWLVENPTN